MCEEDNMIIFEIASNENVQIPLMTIESLNDILFRKLKLRKTCDVFKLTVEHLRYSGEETLSCVVALINKIITNINYLSSHQLNTSVASIIHKGKNKPINHHKSYHQVRVAVLFGHILDEYTRPRFISLIGPVQLHSKYYLSDGCSTTPRMRKIQYWYEEDLPWMLTRWRISVWGLMIGCTWIFGQARKSW